LAVTQGKIYIIGTPIGNEKDITLRALETLRSVDAIICEEYREGSTLLKKLGITKELICINEHNEPEQVAIVLQRVFKGQTFGVVSDCGTPVFADPGAMLVSQAVEYGISVIPVPGPSSLAAALSVCGFPLERFIFAGFLSPKEADRRQELQRLKQHGMPTILMDTPYRMGTLLRDVSRIYGSKTQVMLACNLTQSNERIYRGEIGDIASQVGAHKAEFVLIIKGR
jgi:16S rRNA (cytidine1402-2'-O)-methyltransferase